MDYEAVRKQLEGPMEGLPTIFNSDNSTDGGALKEVVDYMVDGGIRRGSGCMMAGGAVGQFMTMTIPERKRLHEQAVAATDGRVPLVVCCQESGTDQVIELTKHAASIGADAVQVAPPHYYFPGQLDQDDVFRFFAEVASAADIAIVAYHNWWSSVGIEPETLQRMATELESVVAVKWRGRNYYENYRGLKLCADKLTMVENTLQLTLTLAHQLGARGFITYSGLVWPEYDLKLWRLMEERRYAEAGEKQLSLLVPLFELSQKVSGEHANIMAEMMRLAGLPTWTPRRPTRPLPEPAKRELKEIMANAGVPRMKEAVVE